MSDEARGNTLRKQLPDKDKYQDRLIITSDLKLLYLVRQFVVNFMRQIPLPADYENRLVLAVDEAVSNIIEHAYESKTDGYIDIQIARNEKEISFSITDWGKPFNPNRVKKPDIAKSIKAGAKGGLGIFLMKQIMDEVKYTFKSGQNHLYLVKYLALQKEA
ncbi:MAG: ATP-binding protein [Planctomycetes bacterium]|nr:ATP-binding protein [Planctomycetota bacterium]